MRHSRFITSGSRFTTIVRFTQTAVASVLGSFIPLKLARRLAITDIFNKAAAPLPRLSRFIARTGGRATATAPSASRFSQIPVAPPDPGPQLPAASPTIPATRKRLRSIWKAKNFFKPFK